MKKPIIISLFGQPGCGKSTLSSYVFAKLKMLGINCELVTEFAKDKVWEKNNEALSNQIYIFAKQYYRITRCAGQVDVIVTDSPLALSPFYNKDPDIDKPLKELVFAISNKYDNMNYFLRRVKRYNPIGRLQTEKESDEYAIRIKEMLKANGISFKEIDGDLMSADVIVQDVTEKLNIIKE
jgi:ABC-type dipeptide/oligopeptide/nickel transport system ATPase subunit